MALVQKCDVRERGILSGTGKGFFLDVKGIDMSLRDKLREDGGVPAGPAGGINHMIAGCEAVFPDCVGSCEVGFKAHELYRVVKFFFKLFNCL